MKLYLVQHGNAVSEQEDPARPLSQQGREDVEKVASFIKPLDLAVELWHSGKARAAETAEILSHSLKLSNDVHEHSGLSPNDDVEEIAAAVMASGDDVMIVGHLPFLGKLASLLVVPKESANIIDFKQGGIVCLSCSEEGTWQVSWMVTPEIL